MEAKTRELLEGVTGKTFKYENKTITIKSFKKVSNLIIVQTDVRVFNFHENQIEEFVSNLKEIDTNKGIQIHRKPLPTVIKFEKSTTHVKLENSLLSMIDKIEESADAIPQANALCQLANTIISLEKQQLNVLRTVSKI